MATIEVKSEIAGVVFLVKASEGDRLQAQDDVLVLESMKMEIPIAAPAAGTLRRLLVAQGDEVQEEQVVAIIDG